MKTHAMLGLGLVSSLVCVSAATADFQGLDYRVVATNAVTGNFNWTVEIYVVLDAGERLDACAGDGVQDKRLATSGTFYQNAFGGPTSTDINPALYPSFPSLQYDSWVTIGAMDSTGTPFPANALLNLGIDWTAFETLGGDVYTTNGVWFVTPDDTQGQATLFTNQECVDKYGVLVARVTTFDQNASVFLGALFQGKDALGVTWQQSDSISITYPVIVDCNANGVDDGCDIANGTSIDANGNGIPDECEFPDCNGNGIDDNDDIANGTSADCNSNGTPDECEMPTGDCNGNGILDDCETFDDCNDNGIPDECEKFNDCNGNGVPDECEDLQDWDDNGVPDACEGLVAYNTSSGSGYGSFDAAISGANDNDVIWVDGVYADTLVDMDFHGTAVDVQILGGGSPTATVQMAAGASLHVGSMSALVGINSDTSGTASVSSDMHLHASSVNVFRDSSLNLSGGHMILGNINQRMGSELSLDSPTINVDGMWTCSTGSAIYASTVSLNGSMVGTFDLFGSMSNAGTLSATDDVLISSDLTNNGLVAIHRGVLYVLGDLTNNGTILGEVDGGPGLRGGSDEPDAGDGMNIVGNYNAGADASLFMQHENWRLAVGGNFNVAIDDNARFDMSQATLAITNSGVETQEIEVMSTDAGNIEDALDPSYPGSFPLGTLRIDSGSRVVNLVDSNDNDGDQQELSEVMYVHKLVVSSGATLNTNGYIIYASDVDNQGTIIGEDDIIIINPPIPGDLDGDGIVGILDILIVIAEWGPCSGSCISDMNTDGTVDVLDLLVLIANWTP